MSRAVKPDVFKGRQERPRRLFILADIIVKGVFVVVVFIHKIVGLVEVIFAVFKHALADAMVVVEAADHDDNQQHHDNAEQKDKESHDKLLTAPCCR